MFRESAISLITLNNLYYFKLTPPPPSWVSKTIPSTNIGAIGAMGDNYRIRTLWCLMGLDRTKWDAGSNEFKEIKEYKEISDVLLLNLSKFIRFSKFPKKSQWPMANG